MNEELLLLIRFFLTGIMAIAFQSSIMPYRYPARQVVRLSLAFSAIVLSVNIFIFLMLGFTRYFQIAIFTLTLPYSLFFMYIARYKGFQFLFSITTSLAFGGNIALLGSALSALFFEKSLMMNIIFRILIFPLYLYIIIRFLKKPYLILAEQYRHIWLKLCLMPASFFLSFVLLLNHIDALLAPTVIFFALGYFAAYGIIYIFFQQILRRIGTEQDRKLLETQISAFQLQVETIQRNREFIAIQRHDMRHYMGGAAALIQKGNITEAIDFLQAADQNLRAASDINYCDNTIINAMIILYVNQAKQAGISMELNLDIPQVLPSDIDVFELSAIFSNALENAFAACAKQPPGEERRLRFICVAQPRFAFEIANTYHTAITLDENGMPMSASGKHNGRALSIHAFIQKHNAMIDYSVDEIWFHLRIAL